MVDQSWNRTPETPSERATEAEKQENLDSIALGRRIRQLRKLNKLTLDSLGEAVGTAPSQLSLIENGKREPKLSLLNKMAQTFGIKLEEMLTDQPQTRRAALEIELERAQRGPLYQSLGLPTVRITNRISTEVLESLVGLQHELARRLDEQSATPEEARRANNELRQEMRNRNNYYPEIEQRSQELLSAVGHSSGPLSHHVAADIAEHLGFDVHFVRELPHATRSLTDLKNRRIYLTRGRPNDHDPRSVLLQAVGHYVLGHQTPTDYADFLRQRVHTNYFAASLLMPEKTTVAFLKQAKAAKELAIEDLRDAYAVSFETAAHRFTNLATEHLGLTTHFEKVFETGVIHKAYENDGVNFPADHTGAIEGQTVCRYWASRAVFDVPDKFRSFYQYTDTAAGTFWCTARTEKHSSGEYSLSIGVPYEHVKWFRGRDTTERSTSRCPDPNCCKQPPSELSVQWSGKVWPATRANSHLLAAMPQGAFPGVDETEVYKFLAAQEKK